MAAWRDGLGMVLRDQLGGDRRRLAADQVRWLDVVPDRSGDARRICRGGREGELRPRYATT
jgi:hypothetical protein